MLSEGLEVKKRWLEADHADLSLRKQCELLGLNRSSLLRCSPLSRPLTKKILHGEPGQLYVGMLLRIKTDWTLENFYGARRSRISIKL